VNTIFLTEVGAQIKNFYAQAQIAQPKFLIVKTQAQIAQVKNKIRKAQAQIFLKFNKAQIAQRFKKINTVKRKLSNIFKSIITKVYCFKNQCLRSGGSESGASNRCLNAHYFGRLKFVDLLRTVSTCNRKTNDALA